jgi:hypothetical protein
MNSISRLTGLVFAIATIIIISVSSQAEDGITLRATGVPKGGTSPEQMSSKDWANPDELKRTWDDAKVRIPIDTGVIKASMINLRNVPTGKKFLGQHLN